ncbi:hypothetical protein L484_019960 [Morus notabilis]|uniref:Uncharacterized protein n=1 Tax=Morus notabilis TaxID=981085 RepID=W9R7K9_9ROSA|nr:hypothetical protein L484_019960 [Morus notabilis]
MSSVNERSTILTFFNPSQRLGFVLIGLGRGELVLDLNSLDEPLNCLDKVPNLSSKLLYLGVCSGHVLTEHFLSLWPSARFNV